MLIVTGTFQLDPAHIDRLKVAAGIMAKATREEPGCRCYAFWQNVEDETEMRVYEEWDDDAALKAHFETPHMQVFRAALAEGGILRSALFKINGGEMQPL